MSDENIEDSNETDGGGDDENSNDRGEVREQKDSNNGNGLNEDESESTEAEVGDETEETVETENRDSEEIGLWQQRADEARLRIEILATQHDAVSRKSLQIIRWGYVILGLVVAVVSIKPDRVLKYNTVMFLFLFLGSLSILLSMLFSYFVSESEFPIRELYTKFLPLGEISYGDTGHPYEEEYCRNIWGIVYIIEHFERRERNYQKGCIILQKGWLPERWVPKWLPKRLREWWLEEWWWLPKFRHRSVNERDEFLRIARLLLAVGIFLLAAAVVFLILPLGPTTAEGTQIRGDGSNAERFISFPALIWAMSTIAIDDDAITVLEKVDDAGGKTTTKEIAERTAMNEGMVEDSAEFLEEIGVIKFGNGNIRITKTGRQLL